MTFLYWAPESIILLDEQGPSNADQMEDEGFRCAVSIFWGKCFHNNNPQNRKKFEKFVDQKYQQTTDSNETDGRETAA
ncbi:hypothetical protein H0G86_010567 [Trichoderma simmonsii]|uniref:Uncharacterized protein n=1 Tax=Trichoderma simmonsii TaxID=1491479 RepID=A0A8G0LLQ3_9HYPO|nr:hypothetical protein H0G86_010567 [Trichoderma simmonsii]